MERGGVEPLLSQGINLAPSRSANAPSFLNEKKKGRHYTYICKYVNTLKDSAKFWKIKENISSVVPYWHARF